MSLYFGHLSSARVNHGSDASLDNLQNGALTVLVLARQRDRVSNRYLAIKGNGVTWYFYSTSLGRIAFVNNRATTDDTFQSGFEEGFPLNEWRWVAVTFDNAASGNDRVYLYASAVTGSLTETTYSAQTAGSGANGDDASSDLFVGNLSTANSSWPGDIAYVHVVAARMSLEELRHHQSCPFHPHASTKLLVRYAGDADSAAVDLSGNGNRGQLIGAIPSLAPQPLLWPGRPEQPLLPCSRWERSWFLPSGVAAAAGQPTMRRWGGIPGMTPGPMRAGRSW